MRRAEQLDCKGERVDPATIWGGQEANAQGGRTVGRTKHTIPYIVVVRFSVNGQAHVTVTCFILRPLRPMSLSSHDYTKLKKYLAPRGIEPRDPLCSHI